MEQFTEIGKNRRNMSGLLKSMGKGPEKSKGISAWIKVKERVM